MTRAADLRRHALTLCERDEPALRSHPAWVESLRALDAATDADEVVRGLTEEVPVVLAVRYRALQGRLDPLFDHRLLGTVARATDDLGLRGEPVGWPAPERVPSLDDAASLALDDVLWAPVDRVRVPARPAGRPRLDPGARAHFRSMSRLEDDDIAGELNDNVMAEICAMELMARSSYEHPELPWSFHQSCARHAADEARHAAMFRRLLVDRGFDESILLQHVSNYEYAYEFPECDPGSRARGRLEAARPLHGARGSRHRQAPSRDRRARHHRPARHRKGPRLRVARRAVPRGERAGVDPQALHRPRPRPHDRAGAGARPLLRGPTGPADPVPRGRPRAAPAARSRSSRGPTSTAWRSRRARRESCASGRRSPRRSASRSTGGGTTPARRRIPCRRRRTPARRRTTRILRERDAAASGCDLHRSR